MSKKSGGLFALLTGIGLGVAAVFLSKEENRTKTKEVALKTVVKAKKLKAEYQKNPTKVKKQLKATATKVVKAAEKKVKKIAGTAQKKVAQKKAKK